MIEDCDEDIQAFGWLLEVFERVRRLRGDDGESGTNVPGDVIPLVKQVTFSGSAAYTPGRDSVADDQAVSARVFTVSRGRIATRTFRDSGVRLIELKEDRRQAPNASLH